VTIVNIYATLFAPIEKDHFQFWFDIKVKIPAVGEVYNICKGEIKEKVSRVLQEYPFLSNEDYAVFSIGLVPPCVRRSGLTRRNFFG